MVKNIPTPKYPKYKVGDILDIYLAGLKIEIFQVTDLFYHFYYLEDLRFPDNVGKKNFVEKETLEKNGLVIRLGTRFKYNLYWREVNA